jgi:hypothetical protein
MKPSKAMLLLSMITIGVTSQSFSQTLLPPILVTPVNYKYLTSVYSKTSAQPAKLLELRTAAFNVKNSEYYEDDYDNYVISFYIPEGSILAAYDRDGNLLRTIEKFKNISIPAAVREAVAKRFPNWVITKDVYLVNYEDSKGSRKVYKLLLENGNKRLRTKTDESGSFIE